MWLQRLLKQSNYGTGSGGSGGAGGDMGGGSENVTALPGQFQILQQDVPNSEERYNAEKRRKKREKLKRRRKWLSSRDQQLNQ